MAEEANKSSEQPVKRRPGRPRKNPLPAEESVEAPAGAVEETDTADATPAAQADERIGLEVHPLASHIGYDDGRQYLCKDGVIVKLIAN